ncbi:TIGR04255 family protein [Paucibacter sediminis]|uniref:TIGR04255 family protein n=1 Tax=Paucibacter sediminis TaxID=3019553 RepID=A0AA95NJL5_9BURK|nr:TIGR04255 family protein [Paucibacter sp. S2-9]WIT13844.1 TIGR04255 family protein [Paucibacter sp. S2-9]
MAITFAKPPINEVVLGQIFSTRSDLLVPHFGRFWEELADAYPKVSHAPPIVDDQQSEPPIDPSTGAYLPRVWFRSADETRLVQLQQDRLHFNWRQTNTGPAEYPRFPAIKAEFDRVAGLFSRYVEKALGQPLSNSRLELSYINIIPLKEAKIAGVGEFDNVLKCFKWGVGTTALPAPKRFSSNYFFEIDPGTSLTVRINTAKRISDDSDVLKMELVAREIPNVKPRDQWIEDAHQLIVKSFKELTTEKMHQEQWHLVSE